MYFVLDINGKEFSYNDKSSAIKKAKNLYNKGFKGVGVGKYKSGTNTTYKFLPLYYWL